MTPRICPWIAACLCALGALDAHAGDRRKMTGKADGAAIYQNYCSVCHGEAGDGKSNARTSLVPPPADFTNPQLRYRLTREYMAAIVREGKPGTAMVGWKTRLDDTQVAAVVDYVRARFVPRAPAGASGQDIYNSRCYPCHGYSGDARTLAASFLVPAPRNFQQTERSALPLARIVAAVHDGVPGTSMPAFGTVLGREEIAAVAAFVDSEFLERRAANTRYHTAQNGWPDHARYAAAFPFARGEIALDAEERKLTPAQRSGKRIFLEACITCHAR